MLLMRARGNPGENHGPFLPGRWLWPCLALLPLSAPAAEPAPNPSADLFRFGLVQTQNYDPARSRARSWKSAAGAATLATFGNLYKLTALDTRGEIAGFLDDKALASYFPDAAARSATADPIAAHVDSTILRGSLTNAKAVAAISFTVNALVPRVLDKAMAGEGQRDPGRRAAWAEKILAPFNACITAAQTYSEAKGCRSSFLTDFRANLGLAVTYELARQELGESYTAGAMGEYLACVNPFASRAAEIRPCALAAIRKEVTLLARDRLTQIGASRLPGSAINLYQEIAPALEACLHRADDRAGFLECGDSAQIEAGRVIVRERVSSDPAVAVHVHSLSDRAVVAASAGQAFGTCMRASQASGARDAGGSLDTTACENVVTNHAARSVSLFAFRNAITETLPERPAEQENLLRSIDFALSGCWKDEATTTANSSCLRTEILRAAGVVASRRLAAEIPPIVASANPSLQKRLVSSLRSCLGKRLPEDLITAPDTAQVIDRCTTQATRESAIAIAEAQIRGLTKGRISDADSDRLVGELIHHEFAECLGASPSQADTSRCSAGLNRSAAAAIAQVLLPSEISRYVAQSGGAAAIGLTPEAIEEEKKKILAEQEQCSEPAASLQDSAQAQQAVLGCFRKTMASTARFLASATFRQQSGASLTGNLARKQAALVAQFDRDYSGCLAGNDQPGLSPDRYKGAIDGCSTDLSNRYAAAIGRLRLRDAVEQGFDSGDPALLARARLLENSLNQWFGACLDRQGRDTSSRDGCISGLEKRATRDLVLLSTRARLQAQLRSTQVPEAVRARETAFQACLGRGAPPEGCARTFALDFAFELGVLKLRNGLAGALGSREFAAQAPQVSELESGYRDCLGKIRAEGIGKRLSDAAQACADGLETRAVALIQSRSMDWMASSGDTKRARAVKAEIATVIPCMAGLLPPSPVEETAISAADPEGLLKLVAGTIGDFISYDVDRAQASFEAIVSGLFAEMKAAGPQAARASLVNMLAEDGVFDQLTKALVQREVKAAMAAAPAPDKPSAALQAQLVSKANLDRILTPAALAGLRPQVTQRILKPMLLQGKSLQSPELQAAKDGLKKKIAEILLQSPAFGGAIMREGVQRQMNAQDGMTTFFANLLYGEHALDWSYLRQSRSGRAAEAYIRDQILRPKFLGTPLSAAEEAARKKRAEDLIKAAVESS